MAKQTWKDVSIVINGVDLSDHGFNIDLPDSKEQIDVSGFNAQGNKEFLPGARDQEAVFQFLQDFAAAKVHATLQPLYEAGTVFAFLVKPTSAAVSATNPSFGGSAVLYEYNGMSGALGARAEVTGTLKPAPNSTWAWGSA